MPRTPRPPRPTKLSDTIAHRLNLYAFAAAGVGTLTVGSAAEAQVVYTPAHSIILGDASLALDLNHDGVADFLIRNASSIYPSYIFVSMAASGLGSNKVEDTKYVEFTVFNGALKLPAGSEIGPPQSPNFFSTKGVMLESLHGILGTNFLSGYWTGKVEAQYLGLELQIGGVTHYGWARLSVEGFLGVVTGYAYEATPNKPIRAGQTKEDGAAEQTPTKPHAGLQNSTTAQPASLGALALGAPGMTLWRKQ